MILSAVWYFYRSYRHERRFAVKYIVFDMEWNQTRGPEYRLSDGRLLSGEIIEIGAVKLNERFIPVGTFKTYVKPVFYKKIHSRIKELTGITNDLLKDAPEFPEAFESFMDFCGPDFATITWGESDIPVLKENLSANEMGKWETVNYDLQTIFLAQTEKTAQNIALETAAYECEIEFTEQLHDALIDAAITAMIAGKLDMIHGISEYDFTPKDLSELDHLSFEAVRGIENLQKLRSDPRIKYTLCPYCRRPMPATRIITQNSSKKLAKISCADHGDFLLSVRTHKSHDGSFSASKFVYEWNKETEDFYNVRLEAADKKRDKFLNKIRAKESAKKQNNN